jgi:hypothetical protein
MVATGTPCEAARSWSAGGRAPQQLNGHGGSGPHARLHFPCGSIPLRELAQAAAQMAAGIEEASEELMLPRPS